MAPDDAAAGGVAAGCTRCAAWMGFGDMDSNRLHTSHVLSQRGLAAWRAMVLVLCLTTSVTAWTRNLDEGKPLKRYIFLTIWSFDVLTTYFGLALWCTLDGMRMFPGQRLPWTARTRTTAVLFQLTVPMAFTVSVFYWLLLAGGKKPDDLRYELTNPVVHAANSAFVVTEVFLSRNVFHRRHFFVVPLYALTYVAWSAAYTLGADSLIYPILTYRDGWTAVWITLALFFAFVCFPLGHAVTRWRDRCLKPSVAPERGHAQFVDVSTTADRTYYAQPGDDSSAL